MYKNATTLIALLLASLCALAQGGLKPVSPAAVEAAAEDTSRVEFHMSAGTGLAIARGTAQPYLWAAPRLEWHATDRLTLQGGFVAVGSMLADYRLHGLGPRSLAPRRHETQLAGGHLAASWRASDRLTMWAALYRLAGWGQPWYDPTGTALPVDITAFSGGFRYRIGTESLLEMSVTVVNDRHNSLWHLTGYDPWLLHSPLRPCEAAPWF